MRILILMIYTICVHPCSLLYSLLHY